MIEIYVKSYGEVIEQIDEVDLAEYYLSMRLGKIYKSLFRKDDTPSASLYFNKHGRLQYNDFIYHYSLPYAIMTYKGWTEKEMLKNMTESFNLNSLEWFPKVYNNTNKENYIKQEEYTKNTIIKRKLRAFEDHDIAFWNQYGITQGWLQHPAVKVNPISHFWIINNKGERLIRADSYAYCFDYFSYNGRLLKKIYQPYNKMKWISNVTGGVGGVCQLWETLPKQGGDLLIITSSLKDGGTIYCNTFNTLIRNNGVYAIAPNNEGGYLPDQIIGKLNERFKNIIIWFDNDNAGIMAAKKYKEIYGWNYVFNPLGFPKDPSDFRERYGQREFLTLFKYLIYNDY